MFRQPRIKIIETYIFSPQKTLVIFHPQASHSLQETAPLSTRKGIYMQARDRHPHPGMATTICMGGNGQLIFLLFPQQGKGKIAVKEGNLNRSFQEYRVTRSFESRAIAREAHAASSPQPCSGGICSEAKHVNQEDSILYFQDTLLSFLQYFPIMTIWPVAQFPDIIIFICEIVNDSIAGKRKNRETRL